MLGEGAHIVTYQVVPLSVSVGLLRWVDNSVPLGDLLSDEAKRRDDRHQEGWARLRSVASALSARLQSDDPTAVSPWLC